MGLGTRGGLRAEAMVGPGLRPGLSFHWAPQLGQEAEKQVPREFPLFCHLPRSLPCHCWAGAGLGRSKDPGEIPASLVSPRDSGSCAGVMEWRREPPEAFSVEQRLGRRCTRKDQQKRGNEKGRSVVPEWLGHVTKEDTTGK